MPKPRRLRFFFLGPSRSAWPASRSDSAACLTSLWSFLSSMTTLVGRLAVGQPAVGLRGVLEGDPDVLAQLGVLDDALNVGAGPASAATARLGRLLLGCHSSTSRVACCPVAILYPALCGCTRRACGRWRDARRPRAPPRAPRRSPRRRRTSRSSRRCSGMSSMSRSLSAGAMTVRDAVALRGERLLLQPADRQHLAGERDLAGHRDVVAHAAPGDAATTSAVAIVMPALGPSFGIAPAGTWMWMSCSANQSSPSAGRELARGGRARRRAPPGRTRCMTSPSWPVMRELALARHRGGLDEEHVAADGRPGQAVATPGWRRAALGLREEARRPEQLAHARLGDRRPRRGLPLRRLRDLARDLAAHGADLALEVAHAGLARVVADDRPQRARR